MFYAGDQGLDLCHLIRTFVHIRICKRSRFIKVQKLARKKIKIVSFSLYLVTTVFTLSIRTPQLLTIYVLTFEPVQFTTRWCV